MTKREQTIVIACLLLAALAGAALAGTFRLHRHQRQLEAELALLHAAAKSPVRQSQPADTPAFKSETVAKRSAAKALTRDERIELESGRAEIANLRAQLEARDFQIAALSMAPTNQFPNGERMFRGRRGESRQAEMETLQQSDPQRYQEIQAQRTAFRERMKTDTHDKHAFLSSIDISQWPAEMQENHAKIVSLYATLNAAIAQAGDDSEPDHDSRRQLFMQMRETGQLLEAEQDMLLYDTAQQLGFEGADAGQFVEHIKTIHTVTSPRGFFPGRGGGPPAP